MWNKPNRTVLFIEGQKLLKPCNISLESEFCRISLLIAKNPSENQNHVVEPLYMVQRTSVPFHSYV